jgi:hypothetical protein
MLCSQALGQPAVRYLELPNPSSSIPDGLEFHLPTTFPGCHRALVLSWISTASSLVPVNFVSYAPSDHRNSLVDLPLWLLYFAMVLEQSCPENATDTLPYATTTRTTRRHPLMIEAPASCEFVEVLSFRWFQPHSHLASFSGLEKSPRVELPELEGKKEANLLPLILEVKPAVQLQAPDVVHPPTLVTTNSLHLADYIDDPNQPQDPSLAFHSETSSIKADSSHPDLSDVSEPALARTFERISGRRITPRIPLECDQVADASRTRPQSFPEAFSLKSPPPGEYDFGLLSEFPAPPEKG